MTQTPTHKDLFTKYVNASASFGEVIDTLEPDMWNAEIELEGKNVREIVSRVVLGDAQLKAILTGQSNSSAATITADILGEEPVATWRGTVLAALKALEENRDTTLDLDGHSVSIERLISHRISDYVLSGWDISNEAQIGFEIEEDTAGWLLELWNPVASQRIDSEKYPKPVAPRSDSNADRLLAFFGRNGKPS